MIPIRDPLAQEALIRPGAILFFGRAGRSYGGADAPPDLLYDPKRGIFHVGIVTEVRLDSTGRVEGYVLLHGHGRQGRTAAGRTRPEDFHNQERSYRSAGRRAGKGQAKLPPYGNWDQPWVAVAPVFAERDLLTRHGRPLGPAPTLK